jgi:hypothetical protein
MTTEAIHKAYSAVNRVHEALTALVVGTHAAQALFLIVKSFLFVGIAIFLSGFSVQAARWAGAGLVTARATASDETSPTRCLADVPLALAD